MEEQTLDELFSFCHLIIKFSLPFALPWKYKTSSNIRRQIPDYLWNPNIYLFIYLFIHLFIYLFICSFFYSFFHSFLYAPNYSLIEWWQMYQLLQTFLCMFFFVIADDFLFHIRVSTQLPFSVVFQKDNYPSDDFLCCQLVRI